MPEPESKKRGLFRKVFGSKDNGDHDKNSNNKNGNDAPQPPIQAPINYHPYGLKCVAEGTNPTIDIVAVHGLNGHRENTWKAENGVSWLEDKNMLPKRIPNARIFVWGYDARTHGNDYLSQAYLHQHGTQLVGELADERRLDGTSKRPIIFIGHSLGGIVIKSALIHSNSTNDGHLAHHKPIKVSTYGILFMGTPHSGGKGVTMGQIAQSVASIFVHTNDNVLQHLQQQSEWLTKQKDDYASIMRDFVTKFGWEVYPTPLLSGLSSIVVVPQWSAIGWQDNAEPVQIMANHITMVKFRGEDDPEYNKVWKKLAIMAQEAEEKIKKNWVIEEGRQAGAANPDNL
ncbi:Alpha/Beta hydrolase protein [Nemania sp. NC0429]|nr:Alpha/Beta hydrolase protein [Nemania sp. NC0429]